MKKLLIIGLVIQGCKTTQPVTRKADGFVAVYSSSDGKSTLSPNQQNDSFGSSVGVLEKSLKKKPSNVSGWLNLAKIQLAGGEYVKAEESTRQALRYDIKNKAAKLILAQIALKRSQIDLAEILLNGLGGIQSQDSQILNLMALVSLGRKNPSAAHHLFKRSLDRDPSNVAARMNLGVSYLRYRQLRSAARQFERILAIMPNHIDAKIHLATIYTADGKYDEAEKLYEEALAHNAENPLTLYNYAALEKRRGSYKDAVERMKSYLMTDYAKTVSSQGAFAFIQNVSDLEEQKSGQKISDKEIQNLAAEFEKPKPAVANKVESNESKPEQVRTDPSKESKPQPKPVDEDIEELEKALLE